MFRSPVGPVLMNARRLVLLSVLVSTACRIPVEFRRGPVANIEVDRDARPVGYSLSAERLSSGPVRLALGRTEAMSGHRKISYQTSELYLGNRSNPLYELADLFYLAVMVAGMPAVFMAPPVQDRHRRRAGRLQIGAAMLGSLLDPTRTIGFGHTVEVSPDPSPVFDQRTELEPYDAVVPLVNTTLEICVGPDEARCSWQRIDTDAYGEAVVDAFPVGARVLWVRYDGTQWRVEIGRRVARVQVHRHEATPSSMSHLENP